MAHSNIIETDSLCRDFVVGDEVVRALRNVTFSIAAGEFVSIMGTSGSGKSTLLNILGCLDTPRREPILSMALKVLSYFIVFPFGHNYAQLAHKKGQLG